MRWLFLAATLILIDQLSKLFVSSLGWSVFLNDKFAFSLSVPTSIMFIIYFVILIGICFYIYHTWSHFNFLQKLAWSFVFAGGASNVFERIFLGHVRDFIPVFKGILNVADFYILVGLALLLISQRYSLQSGDDVAFSESTNSSSEKI